jgi:hypothetical protein
VRKYLTPKPYIMLGIVSLMLAVGIGLIAQRVILATEQSEGSTGVKYGFSIEEKYFVSKTTVKIWTSRGLNLKYELYPYTVESVSSRWLANNRAIYLDLRLKYHDSVPSVGTVKVIYDFQRGEIYINSPMSFGRIWDTSDRIERNWLSDEDFEMQLSRLDR